MEMTLYFRCVSCTRAYFMTRFKDAGAFYKRCEKGNLAARRVRKATGLPKGRRPGYRTGEMRTERTPHPNHPSPDRRSLGPEAIRVWLLGGFRVSVGSRTIDEGDWRLR